MKKFILIIDGPMGSGKSTVGEIIWSKSKRAVLINTDKIKWFISDYDRSVKDIQINNAVLIRMAEEYLKHDISLVIPQVFWMNVKERFKFITFKDFAKLGKKYKANIFIYHLDAPKEMLLKRIKKRNIVGRTPFPFHRVHENIDSWKQFHKLKGKVFNTDKMSAQNVAKKILGDIRRK